MSSQPPAGYEEVGEALAGPVLEGFKDESWALEIARLLDYGKADLEAWMTHYRRLNREALRWQERKRARRRQKIETLRAEAERLSRPLDG